MKKLWWTFKLLIRGRFKDAWWFYTFIGEEKLKEDFTEDDFEVYYPDEE
jgi:hypothetical protein